MFLSSLHLEESLGNAMSWRSHQVHLRILDECFLLPSVSGCTASGKPDKLFLLGRKRQSCGCLSLESVSTLSSPSTVPGVDTGLVTPSLMKTIPTEKIKVPSRETARDGVMPYIPASSFHVRFQKPIAPSKIHYSEGEFCAAETLGHGLFLNISSL